jgi:hypothetical protein
MMVTVQSKPPELIELRHVSDLFEETSFYYDAEKEEFDFSFYVIVTITLVLLALLITIP